MTGEEEDCRAPCGFAITKSPAEYVGNALKRFAGFFISKNYVAAEIKLFGNFL